MSGSPLHWFRKNQKILLVVFGVLLMIVFTVGGVLDSFFSGQNQNGVEVRKVASTSFGDFTNQDMEDFAESNRRVAEFTFELYRLSKDPAKAKAYPIAPVSSSTTEARDRDILSRLAFAEFARENGIYVGEETINDYFNMLCNNELANQNKTIEQFSRELQRGSLSTVKAHLKTELMARCGQQMLSAGVNPQFSQQGFLVGVSPTPVEIWEGHRRLRDKFKVEYMTIDVESADSITEEPSIDEMKKLYEEGLDRVPNIVLGPGFKEPRKANVAYFAFDNKKFLDEEKGKITEQQIQTLYQEWVENEHRNVTEFPTATIDGGSFEPKTNKNDEGAKQDDAAPQLNSPTNDPKQGENEKKNPNPDAGKQDANKQPSDDKAKGKAESQPAKKDAAKSGDADEKKSKEKEGEAKKQSNSLLNNDGSQFVSLIQEKGTDPKATQENAAKADTDAPKAEPQKIEPPGPEPQKAEPAKTAKQDEASPKDAQPEKKQDENAAPSKNAPSSVPPKAVQDDQEKLKPKIKPLDDTIRELIKDELAAPLATAAIEKAKKEVQSVVSDYLNDYDYYQDNPEEKEYLEVPDFAAIAKEYDIEFKEFCMVDYQTLNKTEFGKATVIDSQQQPRSAPAMIFFANFLTGSTFEITTTEPAEGVEYMYWVTGKKFREKVSFEEAKPRITEYFKTMKAIEAAEAKAAKIAEEVAADNKTLSAVYADKVSISREFGWMEINQQAEEIARMMPQLLQQNPQMFMPRMGSIFPEKPDDAKRVEGVDHGVFSKIFELEKNEIGYAADARKEKVFVFQVIERVAAGADTKEKFFSEFTFDTSRRNSQLDQGPELNEILSGLDLLEKYSVKWFGEQQNK